MTELSQPDRHTKITAAPWSEGEARAVILEIADDALQAFDAEKLWPSHLLDQVPDGVGGVYMGATGVILALDHLKRAGAIAYDRDFNTVLPVLAERDNVWLKQMPLGAYASLLMGDLGPMLLAARLAPNDALADRIFARIEDNNSLPLIELMWGTAGSMLACLFMHESTGQSRWEEMYRVQATRLLGGLETLNGHRLWSQEIYGRHLTSLGIVHGFAGNMFALMRGRRWLTEEQWRQVLELVETLHATAQHSSDGINWPANADKPDEPMLCQICHGAPGIVFALASLPFSTPRLDALLHDAGNLIWAAGPLAKGSNLCHGTGGNGYAFLALYRRSGDPLWLGRAREFAMTAIGQVRAARAEYGRGRYSLWTGDIGLACFLWDCIRGEPAFPSLDFF